MVCEHDARGFAPEWLSETFSTAAFGNSVVAITAGMVAQSAADSVKLAPTSEGSNIMYGGCSSHGGSNHLFLPTGLLQHLSGEAVVLIEHSTSASLNAIYPGEITDTLTPLRSLPSVPLSDQLPACVGHVADPSAEELA